MSDLGRNSWDSHGQNSRAGTENTISIFAKTLARLTAVLIFTCCTTFASLGDEAPIPLVLDGRINSELVAVPVTGDLEMSFVISDGVSGNLQFALRRQRVESARQLAQVASGELKVNDIMYRFSSNSSCEGPRWLSDMCEAAQVYGEKARPSLFQIILFAKSSATAPAGLYAELKERVWESGGELRLDGASYFLARGEREDVLFRCGNLIPHFTGDFYLCLAMGNLSDEIGFNISSRIPGSLLNVDSLLSILVSVELMHKDISRIE